MIKTPDEVGVGQTVYLTPFTKTAGRNVQRRLAVQVKEAKKHWPMVVVTWAEAGESKWELVHKDNITKTRPGAKTAADKREGDTATGHTGGAVARVRKMPGKPPPAQRDGWEEPTLF